MPKATKSEQNVEDLYKFPENEYFPARLTKVEERTFEWQQRDFKTKELKYDSQGNKVMRSKTVWRWQFEITQDVSEKVKKGDTGYGETENELTTLEDNRCRQWAETLLGQEIPLGTDFDTDSVIGLPCMVTFTHEEPRRGRDGTMFYGSAVNEVLPYVAQIPY